MRTFAGQTRTKCGQWNAWLFLATFAVITLARGQVYQELYSFGPTPDGNVPMGELVEGDHGNLYGTTYYGGPWDAGTVFKITPSGTLTILAALDGSWGQNPCYSLVKVADGSFYGTTYDGSVFRVNSCGTLTYINSTVAPAGSFIQGTDGYIYGALAVNSSAYGYIFRRSLDWSAGGILHEFTYNRGPQDGIDPEGGLVQGRDGKFYGTTSQGGTYGYGTVFSITANGQLTTLCSLRGTNSAARYPWGKLLEASDGSFYGAADGAGWGTIFKVSPTGILSTVSVFGDQLGKYPNGGLVEANDGNFYGTAQYFGSNSLGSVFRLTPSGEIRSLLAFTGVGGACPGANPFAGLIQGRDGNLYGTTSVQGTRGSGNVFRIIMPGPQLNSFRTDKQLVLSWRTNYTGYQLETAVALNSTNWSAVTNPPAIAGTQFFVTNQITTGARFFRLKK